MPRKFSYLIPQILEQSNMDRAFDAVVDKLPEPRRTKVRAKRAEYIGAVCSSIADGSFRIGSLKPKRIQEGPKMRDVQVPDIHTRIGSNAIMHVIEHKVYPSVIRTSAASIPGRGMHRLFLKIKSDIKNDPSGTRFFYHGDIEKFYDSVDQDLIWEDVKYRIKDKLLLPILEYFVRALKKGISKGLRSSQYYGNIHLSDIDHIFKDRMRLPYYYRYCDDFLFLASDKKTLWKYRDILHTLVDAKGLKIKPNEIIKPVSAGNDFLGYVYDGEKAPLRKRTKVKAARRLARVKSRKRRQKIIGSFKGMAKWGTCRHLFKVLTGKDMDFKEFKKKKQSEGIEYRNSSGKRILEGQVESLRGLINTRIIIVDFEADVPTKNGPRYAVQFRKVGDERLFKYLTDDNEQKFWLNEARDSRALPFECTIIAVPFGSNKMRYQFT